MIFIRENVPPMPSNRFNDVFHAVVIVSRSQTASFAYAHVRIPAQRLCIARTQHIEPACPSVSAGRVGRVHRHLEKRLLLAKLGSLEGPCFLPANSSQASASLSHRSYAPRRFYSTGNRRATRVIDLHSHRGAPGSCRCNLVSSAATEHARTANAFSNTLLAP